MGLAERLLTSLRSSAGFSFAHFAGVFVVVGHVEVGIHTRLQQGDTAKLVELRRVGIVVEGAGDKRIKERIARCRVTSDCAPQDAHTATSAFAN